MASKHAISQDDFERYPAHGAIIASVLRGAQKSLADANTVEMNEFLRLMFDPVAGRMVRTLFLERLRAERELAAPESAQIAHLTLGPLSAERQAWRDALAGTRLTQTPDPALRPRHGRTSQGGAPGGRAQRRG